MVAARKPKPPPKRSFTPSPTVKGTPGKSNRGGVWRDANNRVIGTSRSEDSPIRKTKGRTAKRSTAR